MLKSLIKLIRPTHWVKNLLIFSPLVLSFGFMDMDNVWVCLRGFVAWSFLASAGYIFNDLQDIENDKQHEQKRHRPLASGAVSLNAAYILLGSLLLLGAGLGLTLPFEGQLILALYVAVNALYSLRLKRVRWVDIVLLSSFYLMRIALGGSIIEAPLTNWFMATCSFGFLAMSANKRMMACHVGGTDPLKGRAYTKADAPLLRLLSIAFAIAAIIFLNLHTIQLLGDTHHPFGLVAVNLLSTLLLMLYFDDSQVKHDDPVKKVLGHLPVLITLGILVIVYLYLLAL